MLTYIQYCMCNIYIYIYGCILSAKFHLHRSKTALLITVKCKLRKCYHGRHAALPHTQTHTLPHMHVLRKCSRFVFGREHKLKCSVVRSPCWVFVHGHVLVYVWLHSGVYETWSECHAMRSLSEGTGNDASFRSGRDFNTTYCVSLLLLVYKHMINYLLYLGSQNNMWSVMLDMMGSASATHNGEEGFVWEIWRKETTWKTVHRW